MTGSAKDFRSFLTYPSALALTSALLFAGCGIIGADGFGFVMEGDHYEKFPQVGRVEIGQNVEIGANSCVDRAALGVTSIGDGARVPGMDGNMGATTGSPGRGVMDGPLTENQRPSKSM